MWLQQDIEIWKKIIFKMQKCENFGSLALLARNNLWNFSSLRSVFPIKAISWALRTKVHYYSENLARSLRSLVIIYEISQVSDVFLWPRLFHEFYAKCENFGSLARKYLWNFSSPYPSYKASYIMSVTKRSTCSIDYWLIYDFTTNYFDKDYMILCKNAINLGSLAPLARNNL